jgi:hypothetical protein
MRNYSFNTPVWGIWNWGSHRKQHFNLFPAITYCSKLYWQSTELGNKRKIKGHFVLKLTASLKHETKEILTKECDHYVTYNHCRKIVILSGKPGSRYLSNVSTRRGSRQLG